MSDEKHVCSRPTNRALCDGCGALVPHLYDPNECPPKPERHCPGCVPVAQEQPRSDGAAREADGLAEASMPTAKPEPQPRPTARERVRDTIASTYERDGVVLDGQAAAERVIEDGDAREDALRAALEKTRTHCPLAEDGTCRDFTAEVDALHAELAAAKEREEGLRAKYDDLVAITTDREKEYDEQSAEFDAAEARVRELESMIEKTPAASLPLMLLSGRIAELEAEAERLQEDYGRACQSIAKMHGAFFGEGSGPRRGVIEDMQDKAAELARLSGVTHSCAECEAKTREIERLTNLYRGADSERIDLQAEVIAMRKKMIAGCGCCHVDEADAATERYRERLDIWTREMIAAAISTSAKVSAEEIKTALELSGSIALIGIGWVDEQTAKREGR